MPFIFTTPPNWSGVFEYEPEYSTDIFESYDGIEQRRAQRFWPRRRLRFSPAEHGDDMRDFMAYVAGGQDELIYVPNHSFKTTLAAPASTGAGSIVVTKAQPYMVQGASLILQNEDAFVRVGILGVAGTTLTLENTLGIDWPAGTKVFESVSCYMTDSLNIQRLTSEVSSGTVEFREFPGLNPQAAPGLWPTTYNSLPLFDRQPDWGDSPRVQFVAQRQVADFGKGAVDILDPRGFAHQITQFGHTGKNEADSQALIEFFNSQRGRAGQFYLPSWSHDMKLATPFLTGTFLFEVEGEQIARRLDDPMHRNIWLRLKDGSSHALPVNAIILSGGNSVLSLDSALGFDVNPEDVLTISWLYLARFSTDRLVFRFLTNDKMDTTISFTSLRES